MPTLRFPSPPTRPELRALIELALPVVVVHLGLMLMGVVDTMMVGRVSAAALGAVALGNLFFFFVAVVGLGTLMALDPIVAQAVGARDEPAIRLGLQRGLILAVLLTVPVSMGLLFAAPVFRLFGQPDELISPAGVYTRILIPGMLPFFVFIVFRQTLQALGRIAPIVAVTLGANVLNALLNWALIFGHLGSPPLGVVGAAWATSVSRWILAVALLAAGWRVLAPRLHPWSREVGALLPLGRMARIGFPIGGQMFLEYGIFALIGLLMGRIGTVAVAGHQVALNLAAIMFMVPQGVGAAAAVLVGHAVGAANVSGARRAAWAAILVGGGFMVGSALIFLAFPGPLARLYTPDPHVIRLAAGLIVLAGLFQVFDGLQAVSIGILRGAGDTRAPVVINVLGFWLIGLPISLLLAFRFAWGPAGLWWGLVVGLAVVAVVLLRRVRLRLRGAVARMVIDRPVPVAEGTEG